MLRHGLMLVSVAGLLGACAQSQLVIPPNLASSPLEVTRHEGRLSIGDYEILAKDAQSQVKKTTYGAIMADEQLLARHEFGFDLAVENDVIDKVDCQRDSRTSSYSNGFTSFTRATHVLRCALRSPDGRYLRGQLDMTAKQSVFNLQGEMLRSQVTLELVPSEHPEAHDPKLAAAFAPAGYEIRLNGVLVGAVQTLEDEPGVWVEERAPPWLRKYVVMAAGVLFLHHDIVGAVDLDVAAF